MSADAFPRYLRHGGGQVMVLDESRLLLSFVDPPSITDLRYQLAQLAVSLEGYEEADRPHEQVPPPGQAGVNHTDHRFWVRTADGARLRPQELYQAFGESLEWVGPVYRLGESGPGQGLVCALPDVLLITLSDHWDVVQQDGDLPPPLRQVRMTEVPEKSEYLSSRYFLLDRPRETPGYEVRRQLLAAASQFIEDVELDYMPLRLPFTLIPNDPMFTDQWNMRQIKAGGTGTTGWDVSTGNPDVVIAVLDTGCKRDHPDLEPMQAGVRLDDMTSPGDDTSPVDRFSAGHGTKIAGVIAARINNGVGVAGVAGNCQIMPLALAQNASSEIEAGINYAAKHGAKVLNMSFTDTTYDIPGVRAAIDYAFSTNMVLCAATGNANIGQIGFPASHPHVIACGASGRDDKRVNTKDWGSNYGAELSVVAPGVDIPTTHYEGGYAPAPPVGAGSTGRGGFLGTSAAAPHVAGLAALMLSRDSGLGNDTVRGIIEDTADKVGGYLYSPLFSVALGHYRRSWNHEMGFGRINVARALATVLRQPKFAVTKAETKEVKEVLEYPIPSIPSIPPILLEVPNATSWPSADLCALYQDLVQRVDQLEEMVQGRSFIRAEDRPEMGLPRLSPGEEADLTSPTQSDVADVDGGAAGRGTG